MTKAGLGSTVHQGRSCWAVELLGCVGLCWAVLGCVGLCWADGMLGW